MVATLWSIDAEPPSPGTLALARFSRRAMATRFEVALPMGTPHAFEAAEAALDLIDEIEDQLTIYREHSEISSINREAFDRAVPVEPQLFKLLQHAQWLHRDTDGAFDIATGALIAAWGFQDRKPAVPSPANLATAMLNSGFRHVLLDDITQSIRFLRPGIKLNLGGIGKGYALDRAAKLLQNDWDIHCALLHGGGSSILGLGTPPGNYRGWPVALKHPAGDGRTLGTVCLRDRALGTSAATYQHFIHNNKLYGHVLDPRTGWPTGTSPSPPWFGREGPGEGSSSPDNLSAANTVASTAAEADALSTATFIMGQTAATAFVQARPQLATVLLAENAPAPLSLNNPPGGYSPPTLLEQTLNDLTLPD